MTETPQNEESTVPVEIPRGTGDRRQRDRRRTDRRAPPPPWRRPWAFVAYGVAAALVVVLLFDHGEPSTADRALTPVPVTPEVDTLHPPAASAPPVDAYTNGEFDRLLAEGSAAVGQRVRTLLYCEEITSFSVMRDVGTQVAPSVAALVGADGRVPTAECKWGADPNAPSFLLVVPPGLAERFAAQPMVQLGFVHRRKVGAEVEWLGRSEALALNTAGVLRAIR
ncbi:MAG TPA: hypothetical protein VFL93_11670 [Longimicrobiaceae bacterium]|jgi:hypothetical protein|nr:hypothetical protein [Longimicrobiaceae bacterium]